MIDYGALPPEINSGRMYAGAGSGPMLAAAAAWDALADELALTAAALETTIIDLQGPWRGPAAMSMAAAGLPFAAWFKATAAQAEQTASQAKAAAAAYHTAFSMHVHPAVIAANRAQLMVLIATNFFGQNTPAIAATEALYGEMWAQDAAAMYGYAGSSLPAAATLTPFKAPPQTTNPAGQAVQPAAATHAAAEATQTIAHAASSLPQHLHSLSTTTATSSPSGSPPPSPYYYITDWSSFQQVFNPFSGISNQLANAGVTMGDDGDTAAVNSLLVRKLFLAEPSLGLLGGKGPVLSTVVQGPALGGAGNGPVLAAAGRAASVGQLSVPRGWSTAVPQQQSSGADPRAAAGELAKSAKPAMAQPPLSLGPMRGSESHYAGNSVIRMQGERNFRMPRPAAGG